MSAIRRDPCDWTSPIGCRRGYSYVTVRTPVMRMVLPLDLWCSRPGAGAGWAQSWSPLVDDESSAVSPLADDADTA